MRPSKESGTVKTKHVFVAVTCIVVVVVLLAGLIGASYVFKSAAKDIVKVGTVSMFNFPDQENSYNCSRRLLYIIV